jgi:hypothetical protein
MNITAIIAIQIHSGGGRIRFNPFSFFDCASLEIIRRWPANGVVIIGIVFLTWLPMPIAPGAGGGPHRKGGKSLSGCDHGRAAAAADHGLRLGRWNGIEGMKRRPLTTNDGRSNDDEAPEDCCTRLVEAFFLKRARHRDAGECNRGDAPYAAVTKSAFIPQSKLKRPCERRSASAFDGTTIRRLLKSAPKCYSSALRPFFVGERGS